MFKEQAICTEIMFCSQSGHEIQIYQYSHSPQTLDIPQPRWKKGEIFHWMSSRARPRLNTSRVAVITT